MTINRELIESISLLEAIKWPVSLGKYRSDISRYSALIVNLLKEAHVPASVKMAISYGVTEVSVSFVRRNGREHTTVSEIKEPHEIANRVIDLY